ncbi:hypothetical protein IAD21_04542 [Abditibacteriota bacterium]|nr:hypothetical protein IAD21_04542 [Abditibacteriota bacterium]
MNTRCCLPFPILLAGCLLALPVGVKAAPAPSDPLEKGFMAPPNSAKPHTWWHWMNGNVTREGITADLEAMKSAGVGGAQIFNVSEGIPAGQALFMTPQWKSMVKFAASEADRLGIELCLHNCAGWSSSGGPWNTPANAMQVVTTSESQVTGPAHFEQALPQPNSKLNFYRDISVLAFPTPGADFRIPNIRQKAAYERGDNIEPAQGPDAPLNATIDSKAILDLTPHFQGGKLTWDVPAGNWTIMRVGYTPTGETNHPASPEGTGLEVDKLSKTALDAHWNGMMQPVIDELGPLAGKSLNNSLIDSYEVGNQNWTPEFAAEFKKRRGYDITPYLPVFTGRVVGNVALSERFLWDVRRTVADLMDENYFKHFGELCHQHGLKFSTEPYGNGPFEDLTAGSTADIPMGEFWVNGAAAETCKLASSVGHVYGHPVIGAESFTAAPGEGKWTNDPYSLKAIGDRIFCAGVNRYIFHRYAMQPWLNRVPGMTMGQWGIHFERTNTLWGPQSAWLGYIARCQFLLQQGHFVADALYFTGENAPVGMRVGDPALPTGYDYDACTSDGLFKRFSVKNGRLVTPDGTSYRVLILPPSPSMTIATLRKVSELVQAGATVIGPRPERSPSLQNYPDCDAQVQTLAAQIWGNCDGKTVTSHAFGKGQIIWGKPLEQVFASLGALPDFSCDTPGSRVAEIHRSTDGSEIYFVSNQRQSTQDLECTFRVTGKVPELWHPDTGQTETANIYREANGRTTIPIHFDPSGSVFVLFRRAAKGTHFTSATHSVSIAGQALAASTPKLEIIKAMYEATDGAGGADVTDKVRAQVHDNTLSVTADNTNFGDPIFMHVKRLRVEYTLNGKAMTAIVGENETLELPAAGLATYPAYEWANDTKGRTQLVNWRGGTLQLQTTTGKRRNVNLPAPATPLELSGPWQLSFPPNWGAPPQVTLNQLISWPQHPDAGVRYFSGTATYTKSFTLPASALKSNTALSLDLGAVKNIARVKVNGHDLGILWKAPFRVDLTSVAQAGTNTLEIGVTNLWPNRLIGDEQLPPDVEWDDIHLKRWPQWLLDGKPSPTGRLTFTTWHHWTKDSPLLDSGLLGPVTVHFGTKINANP